MREKLVRMLGSLFYIGYIPFAPGTFGSLAALFIAWFAPDSLIFLTVFFCAGGLLLAPAVQRAFKHPDPHCFVLDEVGGIFLSVLWIPREVLWYAAAFILFRLFDIWKPGPIRLLQNMSHPASVLWDDWAAGILVNVILQIAVRIY